MARHRPQDRYGVFVILLSDDAAARQRLKDLAARAGLKQVVLCTTDARGQQRNNLAADADVSVAVYGGQWWKVSANFALRKGELNRQRADAIFEAVTRVLPK